MIASYIGYSTNPNIRFAATSGGVGTSILKYLFEKDIIQTSITFDFDKKDLQYKPRLIHHFEEYNINSSIYHEIKLINFIKKHIQDIKGNFACFALPCQTQTIRTILKNAKINSYIIGLTCSSQQSIEATYYLLKRLNIRKEDVKYIQYRGNGWPSGIQIIQNNNIKQFVPNNGSIWTQIFHSRLFIQPRCFQCTDTLNKNSDISLADPWIAQYVTTEKIGLSLIMCNTQQGNKIILELSNKKNIQIESISEQIILKSQRGTLVRKNKYRQRKRITEKIKKICTHKKYRTAILNNKFLFSLHCKLIKIIEQHLM